MRLAISRPRTFPSSLLPVNSLNLRSLPRAKIRRAGSSGFLYCAPVSLVFSLVSLFEKTVEQPLLILPPGYDTGVISGALVSIGSDLGPAELSSGQKVRA